MTQISKPDQASSPTHNQPQDLTLIYQSLLNLTQSHPQSEEDHPIQILSPLNLIGLTSHAILISHSFRLRLPSASSDQSDLSPFLAPDQLSLHLNYSHPQSNLSFEFTFSKIGNRISIAGIAVEDDRLSTLDFSISEYIDSNDFPLKLTQDIQSTSNGFRSSTHLLDFISLFVNQILHNLLPDLIPITTPNQRPPPSTSSSAAPTSNTSRSPQAQPVQPPIDRSQMPGHPHQAAPSSTEIGRSDLDPIGTSNIHIPSLYNRPGRGLPGASGMLVGPNHPIFSRPPQHSGMFGGDGFLPAGAVPPGARFDPIGPGSSNPLPRPGQPFGFDADPMGGLGQGLPLQNPHMGFHPRGPDFNDFRPPGGGGGPRSGYDNMFM